VKEKLTWLTTSFAVVGLALIIWGACQVRTELISAGVTVVTVAFAAMAAVFGAKTWADERRRVIAERQREVYVRLLQHTMKRFAQEQTGSLAELRAEITCWGSSDVLNALSAWNATYDKYVNNTTGVAPLTPEASKGLEYKTAKLAHEIRQAILGTGAGKRDNEAEVEVIKKALFNKRT
jgi:ABC-type phosphate transport system substrate-binding protein